MKFTVGLLIILVILLLVQQLLSNNKTEEVLPQRQQSKDDNPKENVTLAPLLQKIEMLKQPVLSLTRSEKERNSYLGGTPILTTKIEWPRWNDKSLSFLGQIDLSEIDTSIDRMGLPEKGILSFFYDQGQTTWGFDPKDHGSWRVIYTEGSPQERVVHETPKDVDEYGVFKKKCVSITPRRVYPYWLAPEIETLKLNDAQTDEYLDLMEEQYSEYSAHQLMGSPAPIQSNDMDFECQMASNGIYVGDGSYVKDPKVKELESGINDWVLLFQLDSDSDIGMMWGDMGRLYFWIRKEDLVNMKFENCWMILQCG